MYDGDDYGYTVKCKTCGKEIWTPRLTQWGYKKKTYSNMYHYFCSYHCLREYEKEQAPKRNYKTTRS